MTTTVQYSEDRRQILHMSVGVFALLLRFLPWWVAAIVAGSAVGFNAYVLRRLAGHVVYRPAERSRRFPPGIVFYPIAVVLLILLFPDRPDIAAAAWGVMAFGDGAATLVGRRAGGGRIPWNREKSIAGSLAFVVAGGAAGVFLAWWCRPAVTPPPYMWFSFVAPLLAVIVAAAVETLPIRLDDNISVPAAAAGMLWAVSLMSDDLLAAAPVLVAARLPWAIAANVAAAL